MSQNKSVSRPILKIRGPRIGIDNVPPYSGLALIYDRVMGDAVLPEICRSFNESMQSHRLHFASAADIGCGTGRFLRFLARCRPAPLYGVDRSPMMLRLAAKRNQDPSVQLLCQNLRSLALPRPVDLISCNFATLNYLPTPSSLRAGLQRLRQNLRRRGLLICDLIAGDPKQRSETTVQDIRVAGIRSLWIIHTDPRRQRSDGEILTGIRRRDGLHWEREHHRQRWYRLPVMKAMLAETGFDLLGARDMSSGRAADEYSFWVQYLARKR